MGNDYPFDYHALASMRDIKQFSSVDHYYAHFNCLRTFILWQFPRICRAYFLSRFINGLKIEIQVYVLEHHPSSLLDAYELALIQEYSLNCAKKKTNVIVAEQHPNLPDSTVHDGTSLSAVVVSGSTTEQEEIIDPVDGSVEISLTYSVKGLPSATTEAVGYRVQGAVAIAVPPGADVTLAVHNSAVLCHCYVEVEETIKDRGVIVVLRPGDSVPGEYQSPLVEQLDMANYECKCLSANHPLKILSRGLQCIFLYIPCFDPGITSPAFQVAMHWVIVLVLKENGQHMVAFIVFLPRFYSMHNIFQGCLPMGLTKWSITAPSIHSELHSMPFANFQMIRVDMGGSTSKYVPYRELLLDCTSLHLLEAMLLSHPSIIALLMELCPWHTMGAKIQLSRDSTCDPHAGTSHVVLIGIPLPTPFMVLHSYSVEPPIARSVTKGMMQLYNQSSSVDSLAAPLMSSGSSVHLRSNVVTSMLQSSVVTILSILKTSVAQSGAMRCRVEAEHGVVLSTEASTTFL